MIEIKFGILNILLASNPSSQSVNQPDGIIIFSVIGILVLLFIISIIFYKPFSSKKNISSFLKKAISVKISHSRKKDEFKIIIRNNSNKFIEIIAPEIIIKAFFSKKKLKAKSNTYPLTISPGSSHSIIFKKKQLSAGIQKKTGFKLFRVFVFDRDKNVFKSRYRLF